MTEQRCPWRLQRGTALYACDHGGSVHHSIHVVGHPIDISWRAEDVGAFRWEPGGPVVRPQAATEKRMALRPSRVDECDNRQCPNRAGEGAMMVATIFTSPSGGKRNITLVLCAPCVEYLDRTVHR